MAQDSTAPEKKKPAGDKSLKSSSTNDFADATRERQRPEVRGKFLYVGGQKLFVKGVTYGTFAENPETGDFPEPDRVDADFAAMAEAGINTVRVYIVPPPKLLDLAQKHGLRVFVGLPWEQHIAFLDDPRTGDNICKRLKADLKSIAGHPAILAYAVGNEIPATVVRWHGRKPVERFLERLAGLIRDVDPAALVTYVNFPTTEYLELPFVDFHSFNVYLEDVERLAAYMARLQNLAGEKPLLMAELGLDSLRNGPEEQSRSLTSQLTAVFEAGAIGTFVFAWTDEWHRGGFEIDNWDFGLVTRDRAPKPALAAVRDTYAALPLLDRDWPRFSVIVCSYNGASTIGETLSKLSELDYPNYEVIVVNDGSKDTTAEIAETFDCNLITTENRGLSNARNTGLEARSGEYVTYIDDDAYPDPHWLKFLAITFENKGYAAVGGPNIAPPEDGDLAECVANAPGGPVQVLINDEVAEHIPGCNMAFQASALLDIGGFDPQFRTAGDDVDACWRIMENGGVIGFSHTAVVWHHRRPSLRTYFKQQRGYAEAEALVARKWPQKYNRVGHMTWHGRLYGRGLLQSLTQIPRIYHGTWGSAPFQSIYARADGVLASLPQLPEWYFMVGVLLMIGMLGFDWAPLLTALLLGLIGAGVSIAMALKGARQARFQNLSDSPRRAPEWKLRAIVFWLYLLQPAMRLIGRIKYRLGPWSSGRLQLAPFPHRRESELWCETWRDPSSVLKDLQSTLERTRTLNAVGGDYDDWDLAAGLSVFSEVRARILVEEHGGGRQLFRLRSWPVVFTPLLSIIVALCILVAGAFSAGAIVAGTMLTLLTLALAVMAYSSTAEATRLWLTAEDEAFRENG